MYHVMISNIFMTYPNNLVSVYEDLHYTPICTVFDLPEIAMIHNTPAIAEPMSNYKKSFTRKRVTTSVGFVSFREEREKTSNY